MKSGKRHRASVRTATAHFPNGESYDARRQSEVTTYSAACRCRRRSATGGEFAVELGEQGQCGVMNKLAPAEVSAEFCGIGAPLTVKFEPGSVRTPRQRRIADKIVRPGEPGAQDQRHAGDTSDRRSARRVRCGGRCVHRRIGEAEAAAGEVGLAVARRVEILRLHAP